MNPSVELQRQPVDVESPARSSFIEERGVSAAFLEEFTQSIKDELQNENITVKQEYDRGFSGVKAETEFRLCMLLVTVQNANWSKS